MAQLPRLGELDDIQFMQVSRSRRRPCTRGIGALIENRVLLLRRDASGQLSWASLRLVTSGKPRLRIDRRGVYVETDLTRQPHHRDTRTVHSRRFVRFSAVPQGALASLSRIVRGTPTRAGRRRRADAPALVVRVATAKGQWVAQRLAFPLTLRAMLRPPTSSDSLSQMAVQLRALYNRIHGGGARVASAASPGQC